MTVTERTRPEAWPRWALALTLSAAVLVAGGCGRRDAPGAPPIAAGALRGWNVLLVTVDTLRADRVGAYGSRRGVTPTIDGLAASGVRFDRAYAHVPLTLPSHASMLTGSYPARNGVHDNGTFRLGESSPTAAEALKRAGYRTAAFVGAFVLDARFGLGRGFDVYDDRMTGRAEVELVQRDAEQVLAPAREWIVGGGGPWFAWVHLYDPHEPYTPPEPYRSRYAAEPYDGEIAYADAALGAFLAGLRGANAMTNTLVAIASDHGESLGEHGERTHGLFAYDSTLRVPLVLSAPPRLRPGVFGDTMRLVDLVPTVLDLLGVAPLDAVDGRSVRPFLNGERPFDRAPSYFEALNASLTRGWAPLTGVVLDRFKLIDLPVPELYDLEADPGEQHNLYAQRRDRARDLERRLDAATTGTAPAAPGPIDADAEARLRSLGYVLGSPAKTARRYSTDDDPKRLVHLNQALDDASARWTRGDGQGAIDELRGVIGERPDLTVAYDRLAFMLRASGRVAEAVALLDGAAHAGRADRPLLRSLGSMLRESGELPRSAAVLEELVRADAADLQSADALAQTYTRMGRSRDAAAQFQRVLAASPNDAAAWNNLGTAYLAGNRLGEAGAAFARAIAIDPALAGAHNGLGVVFARRGDIPRARAEWKRALELRPDFADARSNLDRVRR